MNRNRLDGAKGTIRALEGLLEVTVLMIVYYILWRRGYDRGVFPNYFGNGKYVLVGVYGLLVVVLFNSFEGFRFGYLRLSEVIISQWISVVIANFITFWQLCLIANVVISPVPILMLTVLDGVIVFVCCYLYVFLYHKLYAPKNMVMVYGSEWSPLGSAVGTTTPGSACIFTGVEEGENEVTFTLAGGTTIVIPKYEAPAEVTLGIEFDAEDLLVMSPNSTRELSYTITSSTGEATIEVVSSSDVKAKVVATDALTGKIEIRTGAAIDEYSKVVVLVTNGEKALMRTILFEEAGLSINSEDTIHVDADGGEAILNFLSNVECEVVIPEDAHSWLSVASTRAMVEHSITLVAAANEGAARSAVVTVKSKDGKLAIEYTVAQGAAKSLFIYGAASEFGEAISGAREFRVIGEKQYQLYTKLTAGEYSLVSSNKEDATSYILSEGLLVEGEGTLQNATEAVYRITVDLVAKSITMEAITGVKMHGCDDGNWTNENYTYVGDGVWECKGITNLGRIAWHGKRYRFAAMANDVEEVWGYYRSNNDGPEVYHYTAEDSTNNNLPPQYIYTRTRGDIDNWSYSFKDGRGGSMEHNLEEVYLHMNGNERHNHPYYQIRCTWGEFYSGDKSQTINTDFVYIGQTL